MSEKGLSSIIAKILIILITVSASFISYLLIIQFFSQPTRDSVVMDIIQITGVNLGEETINVDILNIGKSARLRTFYVESLSGQVLAIYNTSVDLPPGGIFTLTIPKKDLTISNSVRFRAVTERGSQAIYVLRYLTVAPYEPKPLSFYPSSYQIFNGSYAGGLLPDALIHVDGDSFAVNPEPYFQSELNYPHSLDVLSGVLVNGSLDELKIEDGSSIYFHSSPSYIINKTYFSEDIKMAFAEVLSGSVSDTFHQDGSFINFSYIPTLYPINNMNFSQDLEGWAFKLESPNVGVVNVTSRADYLDPIQRSVCRTYDLNRAIHVVYSNGTYLGLSVSLNGGSSFVDHNYIYLSAAPETGFDPSVAADVDNNLHIVYQKNETSVQRLKYLRLKFIPNYGGCPEGTYVANYLSPVAYGGGWPPLYVSQFAHFLATSPALSSVEVYIHNASNSQARLFAEIRRVLLDGTPDLSQDGLISSAEVFNVPSDGGWVHVPLSAKVIVGERYALRLFTNSSGAIFYWRGGNGFYVGGLGIWTKYIYGGWSIDTTKYLLFRIPGWYGWIAAHPVEINSAQGSYRVHPALTIYRNLTYADLSYEQVESAASVYGENYFAQSFSPNIRSLAGVWLMLERVGNPGDLYVEIRADAGGLPDMSAGGLLTSGNVSSGKMIGLNGPAWVDCVFPNVQLNTSQSYWILVESPSSSPSDYWKWYYKSAGDYPRGYAARSSDGGYNWYAEEWDFSFITFASLKELPAVAWCSKNGTNTNVLFLRSLMNGSWRNSSGGLSPDVLYSGGLGDVKISTCSQPNTNALYFFILDSGDLYYNRLFSWTPQQGNWLKGSPSIVVQGVSQMGLASAPDESRNSVVLAFVNSSEGQTYLKLFDPSDAQIDLGHVPGTIRYPAVTCLAGRVYVLYNGSSGIYYRYYDGKWSGEFYYGGISGSQSPNSICRPYLVDFVWVQGGGIVYGALNPIDSLRLEFSKRDSGGNPYGSSGGSMSLNVSDSLLDFSLYRANATFYSNFTSPFDFDNAYASFAWRIHISSAYNNSQNSLRLMSVKLIICDSSGRDLEVVYSDDNGGNGWSSSTGYSYVNGLSLNLNQSSDYRIKITFELFCSEPYEMCNVTIDVDDIGVVFESDSMILEFLGSVDYWGTPAFLELACMPSRDTNCTLRLFDYILNRYSDQGEEGYFEFNTSGGVIDRRVFQFDSGRYVGTGGSWMLLLQFNCNSGALDLGIDLINLVCSLNVHSAEVVFNGSGSGNTWIILSWNITQAFTLPGINVTVQLYNHTSGEYTLSGPGCLNFTSNVLYETRSETLSEGAQDFRNSDGKWSVRVTSSHFEEFHMMVDQLALSPLILSGYLSNFTFFINDINAPSISGGNFSIVFSTNATANVEVRLWNYLESSWTLIYNDLGFGERVILYSIDSRYIGPEESKISFVANADEPYMLTIEKLELNLEP